MTLRIGQYKVIYLSRLQPKPTLVEHLMLLHQVSCLARKYQTRLKKTCWGQTLQLIFWLRHGRKFCKTDTWMVTNASLRYRILYFSLMTDNAHLDQNNKTLKLLRITLADNLMKTYIFFNRLTQYNIVFLHFQVEQRALLKR